MIMSGQNLSCIKSGSILQMFTAGVTYQDRGLGRVWRHLVVVPYGPCVGGDISLQKEVLRDWGGGSWGLF